MYLIKPCQVFSTGVKPVSFPAPCGEREEIAPDSDNAGTKQRELHQMHNVAIAMTRKQMPAVARRTHDDVSKTRIPAHY